jgi:hypothetical protein
MSLVVDNRNAVQGAGVHALIVGVSDYLNLPDFDDPPREATWSLNKLTSAALSAFAMFEEIKQDNLRLPLKSVRLLLSPHPVEIAANPAVANTGAGRANRAAFETDARDWRKDAKSNPEDMTVFFFSGHGIQRGPEEGVLLLEDFLGADEPPLAKCFEIGDIKNGMAPSPSFPNIALTQFYFVDACLTRPETQKKFVDPQVPEVFGAELNVVDRREAPVMFSTVDGAIALGREGKPSHFSEALTLALRDAAENPQPDANGAVVWPITSLTIKTALDAYYDEHELGTKVKLGGVVGTPVIRNLPNPPDVKMIVEVKPENLGPPFGLWIFDEADQPLPQFGPTNEKRVNTTVKAGLYRVRVESDRLQASPYSSRFMFVTQKGPWPWLHNLSNRLKP